MLKDKAKNVIENAKDFRIRIHQTMMSDSIDKIDDSTCKLLTDLSKFIDEALDVCTQQSELLVTIDNEIKAALEKMEG